MAVCLSVTSPYSVKRHERIDLVFGMEASFDQSYTVLSGNSGMYKNKGRQAYFPLELLPKLRT